MADLKNLCQHIEECGICADLDPRDLNPPAAIVDIDHLDRQGVLCDYPTAAATVYLVVPDMGRVQALEMLFEMYEQVRHLTAGASPVTLTLPSTGALPALQLDPITIGD